MLFRSARVPTLKSLIFKYWPSLYGISFEKRVQLVRTVIRIILGCEVWFKPKMFDQKTILTKISSAQHQCLNRAAHRTDSQIACEEITRTP